MGSIQVLSALLLAAAACCCICGQHVLEPRSVQGDQDGVPGIAVGSGSGSGMHIGPTLPPNAITELTLPVCMENELLAFNGTVLFCKPIPERQCKCPGSEEIGDLPTLLPEPPGGCTIFEPPKGGAFTCLSAGSFVIYCSVYCDNVHEFSTVPINPYFCGVPSRFEWIDFTNVEQETLPACTGFRHSLRPLHSPEFYLPTACDSLNATQVGKIKTEFCDLISFFTSMECAVDDVFIQCPGAVESNKQ